MNKAETYAGLFVPHHLDALRASIALAESVEWTSAKVPRSFACQVANAVLANRLPNRRETRSDLLAAAASGNVDGVELAWRILAWGGMRANNGRALFACNNNAWLELCGEVRAGKHNRAGAYDAFARLRRDGCTRGLGPAYFTKLIYFLMPRNAGQSVGYIMDQWVSCAVNVLACDPVVRIGRNFVVSDRNDGAVYDRYCGMIEALAEHCALKPDELEIQLMSKGGRIRASWRNHVLAHREPNP